MEPVTRSDEFQQHLFEKLIKQENETQSLLREIIRRLPATVETKEPEVAPKKTTTRKKTVEKPQE